MLSKNVFLQKVVTFSFAFIIFTTYASRTTFIYFPDKECGLLLARVIARYSQLKPCLQEQQQKGAGKVLQENKIIKNQY